MTEKFVKFKKLKKISSNLMELTLKIIRIKRMEKNIDKELKKFHDKPIIPKHDDSI